MLDDVKKIVIPRTLGEIIFLLVYIFFLTTVYFLSSFFISMVCFTFYKIRLYLFMRLVFFSTFIY